MSQLFTISHLLSNKGLNITEVAHDYQATIKLYVRQLGMVNSYDTWQGKVSIGFQWCSGGVIAGTKNVAKQLCHVCAGTVRTRDRTWFTELSDKGMYFLDILIKNGISGYSARCTKVHLYWCMRNCGGNPVRLRAMIMNISKHFQVCMYIVGGCACVYVCVCDVNVCDCVSFMCISAFHT